MCASSTARGGSWGKSSKHQAPEKLPIPSSKRYRNTQAPDLKMFAQNGTLLRMLELGVWCFSGAWCFPGVWRSDFKSPRSHVIITHNDRISHAKPSRTHHLGHHSLPMIHHQLPQSLANGIH